MTAARGSIRHEGRTIEYDIIRRPAVTRRIHLEMDRNGVLQVVAPRGMSHQALNRALQKRSQRVDRFLGEARARLRDLPELSWLSGEAHLFLGKRYPLEVSVQTSKTGAVALEEGKIRVLSTGDRPEQVKNQVVRWYRQQAQRQFARRLALFCNDAPWVGPIFMLLKRSAPAEAGRIADVFASKEVGEILSHRGLFPSCHPDVENQVPDPAPLMWLGWDFIKQNDLGELIPRVNEIFLKAGE